jgi:hypothetical protein
VYKIFIRSLKGRDDLEDLDIKWEVKIKMDLTEIGFGGVDWIHMTQDRDRWVGSCEHSNEPSCSIKGE